MRSSFELHNVSVITMVIVPSDYIYRLPRYLGSVTSRSFGQNAFSRVFCNQTTLGY
ncbi:hypothetical protein HanIR_Chr15g0780921 [Helianthus annuus]|nr:hypothetical protein HanIR_Chr15g0780921 [Helianthus annuus]